MAMAVYSRKPSNREPSQLDPRASLTELCRFGSDETRKAVGSQQTAHG